MLPAGLSERLEVFIRTARPLLVRDAPVPLQSIAASRLERLLSEIRRPLGEARAGGAFINVWKVAGLKRNELRNAAALAWLLDPRGSHGLLDSVMLALIPRARRAPGWLAAQAEFRTVTVVTEEVPVGSAESRVDISVTGSTFLLFLEVKIDAQERLRQLERYRVEAANKALSLGVRKVTSVNVV